jgi:hypothetical protein
MPPRWNHAGIYLQHCCYWPARWDDGQILNLIKAGHFHRHWQPGSPHGPSTWYSMPSFLLTKDTPVASPSLLVSTSRAIALEITSTLPVFMAGRSAHWVKKNRLWQYCNYDCTVHRKNKRRDLHHFRWALVSMDKREGITFTPACVAPFLIISSCRRGRGGGKKNPSGSFSNPSLVPKMPIIYPPGHSMVFTSSYPIGQSSPRPSILFRLKSFGPKRREIRPQ